MPLVAGPLPVSASVLSTDRCHQQAGKCARQVLRCRWVAQLMKEQLKKVNIIARGTVSAWHNKELNYVTCHNIAQQALYLLS